MKMGSAVVVDVVVDNVFDVVNVQYRCWRCSYQFYSYFSFFFLFFFLSARWYPKLGEASGPRQTAFKFYSSMVGRPKAENA